MAQRQLGGTGGTCRQPRVVGDALARPDSQPKAGPILPNWRFVITGAPPVSDARPVGGAIMQDDSGLAEMVAIVDCNSLLFRAAHASVSIREEMP